MSQSKIPLQDNIINHFYPSHPSAAKLITQNPTSSKPSTTPVSSETMNKNSLKLKKQRHQRPKLTSVEKASEDIKQRKKIKESLRKPSSRPIATSVPIYVAQFTLLKIPMMSYILAKVKNGDKYEPKISFTKKLPPTRRTTPARHRILHLYQGPVLINSDSSERGQSHTESLTAPTIFTLTNYMKKRRHFSHSSYKDAHAPRCPYHRRESNLSLKIGRNIPQRPPPTLISGYTLRWLKMRFFLAS